MNPVFMVILLIVGVGLFTRTMIKKVKLLQALEPTDRFNDIVRFKDTGWFSKIVDRLKSLFIIAIGQKRLVGREKERASGIMHAFIFWGFCVLLIRSLNLYGEGFVSGFQLPLFSENFLLGYLYIVLKDVMEAIVLVMAIYAIYRRAVVKPERLHNTWEAYFVLAMIAILMVSDLLYDGARYNMITQFNNPGHLHFFNNPTYGNEFTWTPVSVFAAKFISGFNAQNTSFIMKMSFWLHITTQLVFLNFLPIGKHFHVITSLPNVFLKSLGYPQEKAEWIDLEDEDAWENESLGINHIHQLDWKQGLDLYTCTECGRCKDVCPTYTTDKPLNLKDFNDSLKHELVDNTDRLILRKGFADLLTGETDEERITTIKEKMVELNCKKTLVGEVIEEDTLWACTTCRACEQVCPVAIEHVPRIVSMRRGQTLMAESYPKELDVALKGIERNGNPWGIGYDKRADWAKDLDVKTMAEDADVDYLLWIGCAGSFDDRTKKVSIALVKILQQAGISFAILGTEEKCTGDFARKVGNEMLYQMMAEENIETLNGYNVKKIIAACPHCMNTLKHEYPQKGGHYEVIHHAQFIDQLVKDGKITLTKSLEGELTYHDPCYLGRYNSVYDEPRNLLNSVAKDGFTELDRCGQESFCCGAGGGRMWMEETIGKRINLERAEEIAGKNVSNVAVGCPFCLTMIEDGMKELGKDEEIKTQDIAEFVANNMV